VKMPIPHTARLLLAIIAILTLSAQPAQAKQPDKNADILGTWTLTKVLDSADVASLTEQQAADLVGKSVVVRRDSFMFNGEPYRAPSLTRHQEPTAKYMREGYHARIGYLGLPDTITVVDLDCTEAFLKSEGKIVVFWRGYFYDAIRQSVAKH
jgi:hypothetical protein